MKIKMAYRRLLTYVIVFLFSVSSLLSQDWNFGKYQFVTGSSSGPLMATKGVSGLKSMGFVGKVGGIAFDEVAVPSSSLIGKRISFSYNPNRIDGQRLEIEIANNKYYPPLYDWELIPIAHFSNSSYDPCVSLFGEETTSEQYDIVYHPAFENTLLGIRLLHADVIIMNPEEFRELPELNGQTIIGLGESGYSGDSWYQSLSEVYNIINNEPFQAWVMIDDNERIEFEISYNGNFDISGSPYYYF